MFENVKADYARVHGPRASRSGSSWRLHLGSMFNYGFMSIAVYRYGRWANGIRVPIVGFVLRAVYGILKVLCEILFGISINVNCRIGKGFYIAHFSNIIVNGHLGEHCSVGQGVTLGTKGDGKSDGVPTVGDGAYIASGAKLIGRITVGDNVTVGANAVVISDIPSNSLAVGVPAKVKPKALPEPERAPALQDERGE